jgi:hypothetical protein
LAGSSVAHSVTFQSSIAGRAARPGFFTSSGIAGPGGSFVMFIQSFVVKLKRHAHHACDRS